MRRAKSRHVLHIVPDLLSRPREAFGCANFCIQSMLKDAEVLCYIQRIHPKQLVGLVLPCLVPPSLLQRCDRIRRIWIGESLRNPSFVYSALDVRRHGLTKRSNEISTCFAVNVKDAGECISDRNSWRRGGISGSWLSMSWSSSHIVKTDSTRFCVGRSFLFFQSSKASVLRPLGASIS